MGNIGGLFYGFGFMEPFGVAAMHYGMKQDIELPLNLNVWNDFFYYIAGFMDNFEPVRWRHTHFHHHSYTIFNDPVDYEIAIKKPSDIFIVFFYTYAFWCNFISHISLLYWETIKTCFWSNY